MHIRPDGKDELVDVTGNPGAAVRDSEILIVSRAVEASLGKVTLAGAVRLPGSYGLNRVRSLQDLLPSTDVFSPGTYMLMGVVKRTDPKTLARSLIPFSPLRVLLKRENMSLASNDIVYILDTDSMRELANSDQLIEDATTPDKAPPQPAAATTDATPAPSSLVSSLLGLTTEESAQLTHVLTEHLVTLTGAVRDSGPYLVAPGTTLDELVAAAGGTDLHADLSGFEVTSTLIDPSSGLSTTTRQTYHLTPAQYASLTLKPYDNVRFREVFSNRESGSIVLEGEVRYPGKYELLRGERLSSVLARAGGLTDEAYPYGAVFTRPSVGKREDEAHSREADDIESAIGAYMTTGQVTGQQQIQVNKEQTAGVEALLARLRSTKSSGRIAIEADPAVLAVEPQFDLLIMPGDHLVIPQRAASVLIAGEVLKPNSILFDPAMSIKDYIDAAGGVTELADDSNIYIIYPNGSAAPVSNSLLSFKGTKIAPGSTIIVPREIVLPTPLLQLVTSISGIVRDLALSAASIAVINK